MLAFRDIKANEIECRIGMANEKGVQLLLYKDARVDMNILDETVGAGNWQREHYECKGNLFCRVGISSAEFEFEWVWKADCGAESNQDKEKGEASDSFKRACVNWGIGRELYTAPFIWINAPFCEKLYQDKGKWKSKDKFVVQKIAIDNKKIVGLAIRHINGSRPCFVWKDPNWKSPKEQQQC